MFNKYYPLVFSRKLGYSEEEKEHIYNLFQDILDLTNTTEEKINKIKIITPDHIIYTQKESDADFIIEGQTSNFSRKSTIAIINSVKNDDSIWYHEMAHAIDNQFNFSTSSGFESIISDYCNNLSRLIHLSEYEYNYFSDKKEVFANIVSWTLLNEKDYSINLELKMKPIVSRLFSNDPTINPLINKINSFFENVDPTEIWFHNTFTEKEVIAAFTDKVKSTM